jgi:hypothetical protein
MKKVFLFIFSCLVVLKAQAAAVDPYIQTIFDHQKVKTTLEFGFGPQTRFFLDRSNKVISIEFITHGYGPESLKSQIEVNRGISNWVPIAFFSGFHGDVNWAPYRYYGSESVYKATSHVCSYHESFSSIDDFYLTEIQSFITNLKKCYKIDVAYIGGSILLRGEIVQILFGKVPVIIGSGTANDSQDYFLYQNLKVPSDYEEIFLESYNATVWVSSKEEYKTLIDSLRAFQ